MTKLHHNLSDESTRTATILHSWGSMGNLIPENDIIKAFADKSKKDRVSSMMNANVSSISVNVNDA